MIKMTPYRFVIVTFCLLLSATSFKAQQTYPIYVTPSLTPPYSLTLSDYSQIGSQRLVVTIMVRDVTVTNLPVRLNIRMETTNGVTIETIPTAPIMPIYLTGGEGLVLFGDDLKDYFNINNLQFKGYSKEEYRRTGQLPEGFYRFTVEVHHFATGRLISNQGVAIAWMALGKPPILKTPDNKAEMGQIAGMPMTFSWLPSNVGVPNNGIQYTFDMWEMRVPGIDPNVIAASMPVFYSATQMSTSLVVQPAMLMLEPGMSYAWRVTASDVMGQVQFAQGGRSEVRTFVYQCRCDSVTGFNVERRGQDVTYRWTPSINNTSFNIEMQNPVSGWSKSERIYNTKYEFKSDTAKTYRARVQAVCQGNEMNPSDFTSWRTVTIPGPLPAPDGCECGKEFPDRPLTNFTLRTDLQPGDTLENSNGDTRYIIKTVNKQSNDTYKGLFWFWWEYYRVKILCEYWDLQVNTDNRIIKYNFESVYNPQFMLNTDAAKAFMDSLGNAIAGLMPQPQVEKLDFVIPDNPEYNYDTQINTIMIVDEAGNTHPVELPKDSTGVVMLPMTIEDSAGNKYELNQNEGEVVMSAMPDHPSGADNTWSEYIILMDNTLDSEDGKIETKGSTRNYFVANNSETRMKLYTRTEYNNGSYQSHEVPCYWYVDSVSLGERMTNEITLSKPQGAYRVEARDSLNNVLIHFTAVFIDAPEIVFTTNPNYDGEYGFDDNSFDEPAQKNSYVQLQGLNQYRIPFMSLCKGEAATIEANIKMNTRGLTRDDMERIVVQFSAPTGIKVAKTGNLASSSNELTVNLNEFRNNKLEIDVKAEQVNENFYISSTIRSNEIGRIQIQVKQKLSASRLKLVKVIINDSIGKNIDIEKIKEEVIDILNQKSYNQGFAQWDISTDSININMETPFTLASVFGRLRTEYRKQVSEFVQFVSVGEAGDYSGWGDPTGIRQERYSIVNINSDKITYIHELGHNHGLSDVREEFPNIIFDTFNFMDYSVKRNMFWKWQWNEIFKIHERNNNNSE